MKPKVTHLSLPDHERQLAAIRAAHQCVSLSDYVTRIIREDAERAGLVQYLNGTRGEVLRDHK